MLMSDFDLNEEDGMSDVDSSVLVGLFERAGNVEMVEILFNYCFFFF